LYHIYIDSSDVTYPTLLAVVSLIPAMVLYPIGNLQEKTPKEMLTYLKTHSGFAFILAILIVLLKLLDSLDFAFALFVLPGFLTILYAYLKPTMSHRGDVMRFGAFWLSIGFSTTFLYFVSNFIPHVADDEHFWKRGGIFTNWYFIK
jgi:hypothetical protein